MKLSIGLGSDRSADCELCLPPFVKYLANRAGALSVFGFPGADDSLQAGPVRPVERVVKILGVVKALKITKGPQPRRPVGD